MRTTRLLRNSFLIIFMLLTSPLLARDWFVHHSASVRQLSG